MRSTPFDATDAPWDESGVAPVYVLKVEWPTGTAYYSTSAWVDGAITVTDRVLSWGGLTQKLTDNMPGGVGLSQLQGTVPGLTVKLRDDDKALLAIIRNRNVQGSVAKMYLSALGEDPTYYKLFEGVIGSQPEWVKGTLALRLSSGEKTLSDLVGHIADSTTFPDVFPEHEGRMLPIVFGKPTRVKTVAVKQGARGRLRADAAVDDLTLYIDGFEDRPSDEVVTLQIGLERLTGTFLGSRFRVTLRGGGVLASGVLQQATDKDHASILHVSTDDLGLVDNAWVGLMVQMTAPQFPSGSALGNPWQSYFGYGSGPHNYPAANWGAQRRIITRYDAAGSELIISPSFTVAHSTEADADAGRVLLPSAIEYFGNVWAPPASTAYSITTQALPHQQGAEVYEIAGGPVYIVADHKVQAIRAVYAKGRRREIAVPQDSPMYLAVGQLGGGAPGILGEDGANQEPPSKDRRTDLVEVPPEHYVVDVNDTTTFPSLGRAVATVTFSVPVTLIPGWEFDDPELVVDVEGYNVGGLVVNPITALEAILGTWAAAVPINAASFASVASSVDWLSADFAITDRRSAQELAADMAWQCRCRALWLDGELHVQYMENVAPANVDFIYGEVVEGSRNISKRPMDGIATELSYTITTKGEVHTFKEEDLRAVAQFGRRGPGEKDFWMYERQAHAQAVARFLLNRLKHEGVMLKVKTPLMHVRNEPGDWVKVYHQGFLYEDTTMEVISIGHSQGSVQGAGKSPEVELSLLAPYGVAPAWNCPSGDVAAGCDLYCEVASDVLPCTAAADIGCDVFDVSYSGWLLGTEPWVDV